MQELAVVLSLLGIALEPPAQAEGKPVAQEEPAPEQSPGEQAPAEPVEAVEPVGEAEVQLIGAEGLDPNLQPAAWYAGGYPEAERGLSLMTGRTSRKGHFVVIITHRNRQPIADDPFHSYLGFDGGGLKVGLGLRYGVLDRLDVGVLRLNGTAELFDTYDFDARYRLLDEAAHGVDLALRAGVSWFSQKDADDAAGFFGQLLVSRLVAHRLLLGANVLYHSDSSSDRKHTSDTGYSVAVAALVEARLSALLAWDVEVSATVAGYHLPYPAFSTGPKIITNRHTFSLVVSNAQYTNADGIVANAWRGRPDKLIFGFNITREL